MPGVGKSTVETLLKREVLHILATEPKPFSKVKFSFVFSDSTEGILFL